MMWKRAGWITIFSMAVGIPAIAQFNDSVHHHINLASTGNINKTNNGTTYLLNNGFRFDINKKHLSINSAAGYVYGENPNQKTNDDFTSSVNVDLFKSINNIYYWGLASFEKSFSLKLGRRFQTGAGVGYNLIIRPKAELVLSDGLLFETTRFLQPDQYGRLKYQTLRNSLRVKFKFIIRDFITVEGVEFLQNSITDIRDYVIRSNTSLSVKLYKWISISLAVNYNRMNLTQTENLLVSYGLVFDRYF